MHVSNILNLGIKELRSLIRDPTMVALIAWSFSLAIYLGGSGVPETLNNAAIAIVDEDRSPLSQRIIDAFYPPYFIRPPLIAQPQMDEGMDAGRFTFALDIPPDFQRDVLAGRSPAIQLNVDATNMSQAWTGSDYIKTIVTDEVREFVRSYRGAAASAVGLELRARFNPSLTHIWFAAVVEVINNVTLLSIVLTGAALIREREHGTIEHLLVMPVTPFEIMASKVWSMALVVLAACTFALVTVVQGVLAVPIEGSRLLFLAGATLNLFATTSMGIFMGTLVRSMPQFGLLLILVVLPMQMLSGGSTPRESMPEFVQTVMLVAPNTHFVMLAQGILFRGAGLDIVWPQFAALVIIGSVLFGIALARFRKTIGTMA